MYEKDSLKLKKLLFGSYKVLLNVIKDKWIVLKLCFFCFIATYLQLILVYQTSNHFSSIIWQSYLVSNMKELVSLFIKNIMITINKMLILPKKDNFLSLKSIIIGFTAERKTKDKKKKDIISQENAKYL